MLEPYSDKRFIEIYHNPNLNSEGIVKAIKKAFGIKSYSTILKQVAKIKCKTRKELGIRKYKFGANND